MSMRELARLASTKNKQSMNEYFLLCFCFPTGCMLLKAAPTFQQFLVSQDPPVNLQPGPADNLVVEMLLHPFPAIGSVTAAHLGIEIIGLHTLAQAFGVIHVAPQAGLALNGSIHHPVGIRSDDRQPKSLSLQHTHTETFPPGRQHENISGL